MTVKAESLPDFVGKKVTVQVNEDGKTVEYDGTVQAASAGGIAFKPVGKGMVVLEPAEILDIKAAATKPKGLVVKHLKKPDLDDVKQHLIDRHGYKVADIEKYSAQAALDFHNGLDHGPLGHDHNKPEPKAATASAGQESAEQKVA